MKSSFDQGGKLNSLDGCGVGEKTLRVRAESNRTQRRTCGRCGEQSGDRCSNAAASRTFHGRRGIDEKKDVRGRRRCRALRCVDA